MSWFTTLTDFPEFGDGWAAGWRVAVLAGLGGLLVRLMLRRRLTPGLAGPAWVLGSLAALNGWWGLPGVGLEARAGWIPAGLFLGLLALAGGVELAMHTPNPKAIGVLLAFPGAVIVGVASDFQGPGWVRPLVIATITLGAPMVADLDRRSARLALGPLLWLVTVIGVYATVPDTELVRPLVGVAIPVALLGFPIGLARLGGAGSAAAVGLLVWIGAQQGYGRPGSIVGVAAALGVFWAEPTGRSLLRRWVAAARARGAAASACRRRVRRAHLAHLVRHSSGGILAVRHGRGRAVGAGTPGRAGARRLGRDHPAASPNPASADGRAAD